MSVTSEQVPPATEGCPLAGGGAKAADAAAGEAGRCGLQPGVLGGEAGVDRPAPADRLPVRPLGPGEDGVAVWWLGVHGGAGESTLQELFRGSRAAGHAWPLGVSDADAPPVVLVARTNARGLHATQDAIRDRAAVGLPVALLGLVLIADAPGRLPRALRDLASLIGGGVPRVWSLPWVEAWRAGETPTPANSPASARRLLGDLRALTSTGSEFKERGV